MTQQSATEWEQRRLRIGVAGIGVGLILLTAGIVVAHFTGLPETNNVGQEIYAWIPRCLAFEGDSCFILPTLGQLTALLGSQILLAAVLYGWILGRPLTWASASTAALLFTAEMIILFGVIPNQWLAIAQGDLEWTGQKIAFTITPLWALATVMAITVLAGLAMVAASLSSDQPIRRFLPMLVTTAVALSILGWLLAANEVSISYGTLKDLVSGGYSATMLGILAVGAYQIQERSKRRAAAPPPAKVSPYGRPVVKGRR